MKDAIQDYHVNSDDPDHESDVNDAVEGVQETVCETFLLSFWNPYIMSSSMHAPLPPLSLSMHCIEITLLPQFDCCGVDNATDWLRFNNASVLQNDNIPPAGALQISY